MSEVTSTFQKRPAYRYIRKTDKLPTIAEVIDKPLDKIIAKIRLFMADANGTWWIAAYDPDTGNAYGVAEIWEREVGEFHMPELVDLRGRFGLPVERDLYSFTPMSLAAILAGGGS